MPLTPFHLGPGAFFKSVGGRHFSFMVFGGSQVLMDVEPLVRILRGDDILHGFSHTVLGAFLVALVAGLIGRPISLFVLDLLKIRHRRFGWGVSFLTAFVGTFSHVVLDALMHSDMRPFWPLAETNPLLGLISVPVIHLLCLASAVSAGCIAGARFLIQRKSSSTK